MNISSTWNKNVHTAGQKLERERSAKALRDRNGDHGGCGGDVRFGLFDAGVSLPDTTLFL